MATPPPTLATRCLWLTILMVGSPPAWAAPPADESLTKLAVLDPLVGSWVFKPEQPDGFSARQECKWILNKQFLEIDTHVLLPGQPPASWRTLITYDETSNCYRQWKFSDKGVVSTEQGAWNENKSSLKKKSSLNLSGRTPNGNDSKSKFEIIEDNSMIVEVSEFLDDKHTRMATVRFTLRRVPPKKDPQLTK